MGVMDFAISLYELFDMDFRLELSTRPEQRVGDDAIWDRAEHALQTALERARRAVRGERGRRRLLRPEDRRAPDRRARPLVAVRHVPARLQLARALRPHLHGRRRPRPPAGDDPPRDAGLVRALHRHPDRALRRRVPAVAGADAGHPAADRRPARGRTRSRRRRRSRTPACAPRSTAAPSRSARRSPRPRRARSPRCWWSATARPSSRPSRCAATAAATSAPSRSRS